MRMGYAGIIAVAILALEIVGMALVGGRIGVLSVILWLVADLFLGAWLIRSTGAGLMPELMQAAHSGRDPISALWRTGRRFLAGLLLIFPGFFSDAVALLLLLSAGLPQAPAPAARQNPASGPSPGQPRGARSGPGGRDDGVIEGEFRREDD